MGVSDPDPPAVVPLITAWVIRRRAPPDVRSPKCSSHICQTAGTDCVRPPHLLGESLGVSLLVMGSPGHKVVSPIVELAIFCEDANPEFYRCGSSAPRENPNTCLPSMRKSLIEVTGREGRRSSCSSFRLSGPSINFPNVCIRLDGLTAGKKLLC